MRICRAGLKQSHGCLVQPASKTPKTAEYVYRTVIGHNRAKIYEWIMDASKTRPEHFDHTFSKPIGYGVSKSGSHVFRIFKATVVLIKTADGIKVLTAYPIIGD